MWQYEKKLQYPVKIANPNPALAKVIISQLGGPDGELGAALHTTSSSSCKVGVILVPVTLKTGKNNIDMITAAAATTRSDATVLRSILRYSRLS